MTTGGRETPLLERFADEGGLLSRAAGVLAGAARAAARDRGRFHLVLAGGHTPLALYRRLANSPWRECIPWDRTHVYWSDERCLPPTHPDSNQRAAREALLDEVPIVPGRIHRIPAEEGPERGAELYQEDLRAIFPSSPFPAFDLCILGVGADGHTASLFYGDEALAEKERWVAPVPRSWGSPPVPRVTLTLPALNASRSVLFLVVAKGKERVLKKLLEPGAGESSLPASLILPSGVPPLWLVLAY
jgi:6-phosphogluconolactonase